MSELDRAIAERLGWRIELRIERNGYSVDEWNWYAIDKFDSARREFRIPYTRRDWDESKAWDEAFSLEDGVSIIPRYTDDLNAAVSLPLPVGFRFEIAIFADGSCSVDILGENYPRHDSCLLMSDLAETVCKVWKQWSDKRQDTGGDDA